MSSVCVDGYFPIFCEVRIYVVLSIQYGTVEMVLCFQFKPVYVILNIIIYLQLIRVCGQHAQVHEALRIYDRMRSSVLEGGLGLTPTVYTYTAAMRAALNAHMFDKAANIWDDALRSDCVPDCRLATTYMEVGEP